MCYEIVEKPRKIYRIYFYIFLKLTPELILNKSKWNSIFKRILLKNDSTKNYSV